MCGHIASFVKSFNVGHMGISALKCHAQGQGHVKVAGQLNSERIKTHFMKESAVAAKQTKSHKQPRYIGKSGRETSREH